MCPLAACIQRMIVPRLARDKRSEHTQNERCVLRSGVFPPGESRSVRENSFAKPYFSPIESRKKDGFYERSVYQDRPETIPRKICEQNEISLPRQARHKPQTTLIAKQESHFLPQVVVLCDGRLGHNRIRRGYRQVRAKNAR